MRRDLLRAAGLAAAGVVLLCGSARAANPSIADCLTATEVSIKFRREHLLRAQRAQLLICASTSCPGEIRKECIRRVDEVDAAIPTLIFEAKDAAGNDLGAVKVTMDGEVLAEHLDGTALPVDPGEHTFVLETAGLPLVQKHFVLLEGQKGRRESVTFAAPAPAPPTAQPAPPPSPTPAPPPPPERADGMGAQRVLALVAGGVGIVGLGLGTAFGLAALSKRNSAQQECAAQCATQDGVSMWSDAKSTANVSTVGFVVGGIGLAGAAVLWFTAPAGSDARAQVGIGPGALRVSGAW
jgi:hypothetical protein